MSTTARTPIALRIPADDLAAINSEAQRHGLSRTEYMVRASTHTLDHITNALEQRVEYLERAVERLEHYANLSA